MVSEKWRVVAIPEGLEESRISVHDIVPAGRGMAHGRDRGDAYGSVRFKATKGLVLHVSDRTDLRYIQQFGPDDLWGLSLALLDITDKDLRFLAGLTGLCVLDLTYTDITDKGLVYLESLTNLEYLSLVQTKVSDKGLVHLKTLTGLRGLQLQYTRVRGLGLAHLGELTSLEELGLSGYGLEKEAMDALQQFGALRRLMYTRTSGTSPSLQMLQRLLPACSIDMD